jgi:hypothetical protein
MLLRQGKFLIYRGEYLHNNSSSLDFPYNNITYNSF